VSQSVVKIDPEIMSGAPCFAVTRVPIQNLIDYLKGGDSIEDFLEGFPNGKAKPYQVKQVRELLLKYKIDIE